MDEFYIRKVCNGDVQAYRYFIKKFQAVSLSVALSIVKDQFVAEEIVQDAFVKAFNAMPGFRSDSKFSSWFYRIVVNEAFMQLKRAKHQVEYREYYEEDIVDEHEVLSLQNEEQAQLINRALLMLPPNESLALQLFYLQEESLREVCAATGWTTANAKVILHRARKSIRMAMNNLLKNSNI